MLQRIDSESASRSLARWLRHAGLAMITLASGTLADDQPAGARLGSDPPESSVSGRKRLPQDGWSRSKTRVAVVPEALTNEWPFAKTLPGDQTPPLKTSDVSAGDVRAGDAPAGNVPAHDISAGQVAPRHVEEFGSTTVPQAAEQAGAEIAAGPNYSDSTRETFEAAHRRRIENLMAGSSAPGSMKSVGDWWHEHSQQFVNQNRHFVVTADEVPRATQEAVQQFIAEHTLPEDFVPDVDFYDSNPIALSAPSMLPPDVPPASEDSDTSRLKTDIRTIEPTLSYALRGIDRTHLPEDFDQPIDNGEYVARQTSPTVLQWAPTNLWHYPLYFEDPSLERYGHSYHPLVQPFASTGRFATQLAGLPYQMTLHPVNSKQYPLGYYRPGEWAPKKLYQIPFNEEATLMEVATIAGLILIIP